LWYVISFDCICIIRDAYLFCIDISINTPQFCPSFGWNPKAITIANTVDIGPAPHGLFVDSGNRLFAPHRSNPVVKYWLAGAPSSFIINISSNMVTPETSFGVFRDMKGDIYVSKNRSTSAIDRFTINGAFNGTVWNTPSPCTAIFIDTHHAIYCSTAQAHQVWKRSLNNTFGLQTIVGTGVNGSGANQLDSPGGIFVDFNSTLFVADTNNHRIQRFLVGNLNGMTVVGNSNASSINLTRPTAVVLDGAWNLYIVDSGNHRIVMFESGNLRCIIGCGNSSGSGSSQLNSPRSLSFDSYGNLYVTDFGNNRIQKFLLSEDACSE
jgi:hypothetical protein